MADVTRVRDRGQLILVTGLLVAVTMVALVLLLNTAIYTDNLASRGADQSSREAVEYRAIVIDGVGGLIDEENGREHADYAYAESNVTEGIDTIDNFTARSYATGGTVVRINQSASSLTVTEGKLVRQPNPREFRNESGAPDDWELASGVSDDELRDFRMNVSRSSLNSGDASAFNVHLEDTGGTRWQAFVYDKGGSEVAVSTSIDGNPTTEVCSVSTSEATIDLTRETIAGEPCPDLNWAEGLTGEYDLEYHNPENATGTYNVTINTTPAGTSVNTTNVVSGPSSTVYHVPAVYSASFEITYESPTLTYRTDVRIAPGEPR